MSGGGYYIKVTQALTETLEYPNAGGYLISTSGDALINKTGGGDSDTEIFIFSCGLATPPLRQKQRDDYWNAPRMKVGPQAGGQPSSIQESLRQTWGSNTYLLDREKCGC